MTLMPGSETAGSEQLVRTRDPEQTRQALLQAAEREIHLHGYQAASLSQIITEAGVTKGALYHHFANKQALGYAVFDEIWAPQMRALWMEPLRGGAADPVQALIDRMVATGDSMSDGDLSLGCPVNNLAQEMSPIDEGFRVRVNTLLEEWRDAIAAALRHGQATGSVTRRIGAEAAATMLVASLEGCLGMAKNAQSRELLAQCGSGVIDYLQTLRA
jgi:AcrR family transcriptional regulator